MGYYRAGFDVTGVDIVRQPDYPFTFHQGDAHTFPLEDFDAVHASPPCQLFTGARGDRHALRLFDPHTDQLTPTLTRLASVSVPWAVENVPGAPMPPGSVLLCGSMFGLDVRRHRLFALNVPMVAPVCDHRRQPAGRFQSLDWSRRQAGIRDATVGVHGNVQGGEDTLEARQAAMGIDWLPNDRLTQAIPPAYTQLVGRFLLAACQVYR